jgi:hypothetical protein
MTIFLSRASQQYAARQNPYTVSATIPDGVTVNSVKVTLTRESWPVGPVGTVTLTFPDGATAGFGFDGGDIPIKGGGGTLAASSCEFSRQDLDGNAVPFPVGSYSLDFKVLQTVRTAVTVERF